jgi:uncharacterized protein YbjQ (UPF0145 family)
MRPSLQQSRDTFGSNQQLSQVQKRTVYQPKKVVTAQPVIQLNVLKDKLTSIQSNKQLLEQKISEYENMLKAMQV